MSEPLESLKAELERFGEANDAATNERSRRMLKTDGSFRRAGEVRSGVFDLPGSGGQRRVPGREGVIVKRLPQP